ncbi:MAG: pentapeptide repeat-containing protein [Cyanobacteria bacterium J06649_4]
MSKELAMGSSVKSSLIAGTVIMFILGWGAIAQPASASSQAHPPLTIKQLDQQIEAAKEPGSAAIVNLKAFTIDLREASPAVGKAQEKPFADQFYEHLQRGLNPRNSPIATPDRSSNDADNLSSSSAPDSVPSQALGLDLSDAVILGDFNLSRLGLRIPSYSASFPPELTAFNQKVGNQKIGNQKIGQISSPAETSYRRSSSLGYERRRAGISTTALSRFLLPSARPPRLDTYAFRGPLLLNRTCFSGAFDASTLYFFNRVEASGTIFTYSANWQGSKFARSVNFDRAQFQQDSTFRTAIFAGRSRFSQAQFNGASSWQGATFYPMVSFAQATFGDANFARSHWQTNADFDRAIFQGNSNFQKSRFDQSLFLTEAQLEGPVSFRQAQFQRSVNLRGAHIFNQVDFGDARFAAPVTTASSQLVSSPAVTINVADLDFSASEAQILGSPGQMGQRFSLPTLTSNETVMRNLVRNFRSLEQIEDANQLEYTTERLRLAQIKRQIFGTSLNQASQAQFIRLGLTPIQAQAIVDQRKEQSFVSRSDLLGIDVIDLATYLRVRDRLTTQPTNIVIRTQRFIRWLMLASLLLLSQYGTNVSLVFGVGLLITTAFALMFWLIDRYRRRAPVPLVPTRAESVAIAIGSASTVSVAFTLLSQSNPHPIRTLLAVGCLVLPVPAFLIGMLYGQPQAYELTASSYFVENGALRRLQVLIARLPVPPKYPFYRDRYTPLLSDRRWNWLNYFDFSLNNWFKFGFNDIRLRGKCVPGWVSALVWYQWGLGVVYITLLLWTLSRTIPGLNLLLYF